MLKVEYSGSHEEGYKLIHRLTHRYLCIKNGKRRRKRLMSQVATIRVVNKKAFSEEDQNRSDTYVKKTALLVRIRRKPKRKVLRKRDSISHKRECLPDASLLWLPSAGPEGDILDARIDFVHRAAMRTFCLSFLCIFCPRKHSNGKWKDTWFEHREKWRYFSGTRATRRQASQLHNCSRQHPPSTNQSSQLYVGTNPHYT